MRWDETTASKCRYGERAGKIWGDWEIIWEDSEADYQGHASFIAQKGRRYCFYEWHYGSCSGCDGWEADESTDEAIEKEMRDTALWLDSKKQLKEWLQMMEGNAPISNYSMERGGGLAAGIDILGGRLLDRINAIRAHFGMPSYVPKKGSS
jgi:hypothetical protein